jgi:hypothetical protein
MQPLLELQDDIDERDTLGIALLRVKGLELPEFGAG